jgi:cysteine-rich repeat protein
MSSGMTQRVISSVRGPLPLALAFVGLLSGCLEPAPTPEVPLEIVDFRASSRTVRPGEEVTLTWWVKGAVTVSVIAAPDRTLVSGSSELEGSVATGPLSQTTNFTLIARGPRGESLQRLTVAVEDRSDAVAITQLGLTPMTIEPGGRASLTYATVNARRVRIDAVDGPNLLDTTTQLNGIVSVTATVSTSYALTAEGPGGPITLTVSLLVAGTPQIQEFKAEPQSIEAGGEAVLTWQVNGASEVRLQDESGTILIASAPSTGSLPVRPAQSTRYILTARGMAGQEVTRTLMVTVERGPQIERFEVSPDAIDYGESAELRWRVARAPGGIELSAWGAVIATSTRSEGSLTVTATRTTEYTLTAKSPGGDSVATATLRVNPAAPRIARFAGPQRPVLIGERGALVWEVFAATSVRIEGDAGTVILEDAPPAGRLEVDLWVPVQTYTLVATNPNGVSRATAVVFGQYPPGVARFVATPDLFLGANGTAVLEWDAPDATVTSLELDGAPVTGFPGTPSGTFTPAVLTGTSVFTLTASNAVGLARATVAVVQVSSIPETGSEAVDAVTLTAEESGSLGTIGPGDVDFFSVTVPEAGSVRALTRSLTGGCGFDSVLTLYAPDGTTVLGVDQDDGPRGGCSAIEPGRDAFARDLPAGVYFLAVRAARPAQAGAYVLRVTIGGPGCGNSLTERRTGEECDDGNVRSGDGCGAACELELASTGQGPGGGPSTLTDVLGRSGDVRLHRIFMARPGFIRAETFIPVPGRCTSTAEFGDLRLRLFDDAFTELGQDDNGGIGACAAIEPRFRPWAQVPSGTYYVAVEEKDPSTRGGVYALVLETMDLGCANGIIEGPVETCDDGNLVDGDGCNAACQLEGAAAEVEPNDAAPNAIMAAPGGAITRVVAALSPVADVDLFSVQVPAGHHLSARVTVNGFDDCDDAASLVLELRDASGALLTQQVQGDYGPAGRGERCARVWPYTDPVTFGMTAGSYTLAVRADGDDSEVPLYFLQLRVLPPGCGNSVIEGAEQCDDGNGASGDGCSAACTFEPSAIVALGPSTAVTIAGQLRPSHARHVTRLDVAQPVYLRADSFSPAVALGCSDDLVLRLFDATGSTELGTSGDDRPGCGRIRRDAPFARLEPGQYLLVTESRGNVSVVAGFELAVRGAPVDRCGNGVRELVEFCDDGNVAGGDGCSNSCALEPLAVIAGPPAQPAPIPLSIATAGVEPLVRLDLAGPSVIIAETGAPIVGDCSGPGLLLELFEGPNAERLVAVSGAQGFGSCALLDGREDLAARVGPGTYHLRVREESGIALLPALQLRVDVRRGNECGNGALEVGERCDDGNRVAGDGCSAVCRLELAGSLAGPGPRQVVSDGIAVAGQRDWFALRVTRPAIARVEVGTPTLAGGCAPGAELLLWLFDDRLRARDLSTYAADICARLDGTAVAESRLPPGDYFLLVEENGADAPIPAYQLAVELTPQACGNGILEPLIAETCDDGGLVPQDGCSATCAREGADVRPEREPNDATSALRDLGTLAPGVVDVVGAADRFDDRDLFRFTLAAPASVLVATSEVPGASLSSCSFDTELWLYGGVPTNLDATDAASEPTLIEYDNDDGAGRCALMGGTDVAPLRRSLAAGTYLVQVRSFGGLSIIPAYQLRFDVQ